jgi:type I restriction enzyme S subunit
MKMVLLGDLISIKSGKSRPKLSGDFPVYGGNGIFGSAPQPNMTEPAVIVGRVGAYCGSVYIEKNPFWLSDNALGVTVKHTDDLGYIYYLLKSINLNSKAVGGAQPLLTQGILNSITVSTPTLESQKEIANILGTIDRKIKIGKHINETLQRIGQALFEQHFIKNPEGENWTVAPLTKQFEILSGGTPKTSEPAYWDGDIPWFSVVDVPDGSDLFTVQTAKNITELGLNKSATKLIPKYTTIISARGTVGKLAMAGREMTINQSCYALKSEHPFYTYLLLHKSITQIQANVHGAVFDTITRDTFERLKAPMPPAGIINDFEDKVRPIFLQILRNVEETQGLISLRDTLLPRLISGKINVS